MTALGNRRSTVVLYSDATRLQSHRVRLVLAEKSVDVQRIIVDPLDPPDDLQALNPGNDTPTLVDRDLALYDAGVIIDYVDERYPHPPLMPVDPVSRARTRLTLHRLQADWLSLAEVLARESERHADWQADAATAGGLTADECRRRLSASLLASKDVFSAMPFFLSETFSVLDATIAPLLWRLPHYGIVLPPSARTVVDYANRQFKRPGFEASLTPQEREMRA